MDISKVVDKELTFEFKLLAPDEKRTPLGIVWNVYPPTNKKTKHFANEAADSVMDRVYKKKTPKQRDAQIADIKTIASTVQSWDWGGHGWGDDTTEPEHSLEKVIEILTDADWIFWDLKEFLANIENFIPRSNLASLSKLDKLSDTTSKTKTAKLDESETKGLGTAT